MKICMVLKLTQYLPSIYEMRFMIKKSCLKYTLLFQNGFFLKTCGTTTVSTDHLPLYYVFIIVWGNPLIVENGIHPCRQPFHAGFKNRYINASKAK